MARSTILSFDGIDGVGKSSVAKAVARRLRRSGLAVRYVHSPAAPYRSLKSVVEASTQVRERYHYYLAANYNLSEQIKSGEDSVTIVDRYVYSTHAYHVIHDPEIEWEGFSAGLVEPTVGYLVSVRDADIQLSRLTRRDGVVDDKDVLLADWSRLAREFDKFALVQIDNSDPGLAGAVDAVMRSLPSGLMHGLPMIAERTTAKPRSQRIG